MAVRLLPSLPLRAWTAVTGTALAVLFGVLLVREASPEWRRHQRRFLQVQRQVAERAVADAEKSLGQPEVRARLVEAEQRLEEAKRAQLVRERNGDYDRARQRLEKAEQQLTDARDALQRTRADYQTIERNFLLATNDEARARWRPDLERLRVEVERLVVESDRKTKTRDEAAQSLQSLTAEVVSALQALARIRESLEKARAALNAAGSQSARIEQLLVDPLNRVDRCTSCHVASTRQGIATTPEPLRNHVGRYVADHAPERFGCTICHGGQGRATRLPAAHGRVAFWREPALDLDLMGGRCAVCHRGATVPGEPYAGGGRRLFQELGCQGCHDVEGLSAARVGPSLADIGSKVGPRWLAIWLRNPKAYLPKTRMPNFRLADQEIANLSAFLLSLRRADAPPDRDSRFAVTPGAAKRGETLFKESRCITCHAINGRGGTLGPDLGHVASKVREAWLLEFLQDPARILPGTRMPRYRFTAAEAADLVAYFSQELRDFDEQAWPPPSAAGNVEEGRRIVRKYGCFGCHVIPTFEQVGKVGAELTGYAGKEVDRLDFGLRRDVPRTWRDWTDTKLRDPRGFRDGLKMPDFQFTDRERFSLLTYLASLSEEKPPAEYLRELPPAVPYRPEGRFGDLAAELNCLVCHAIRGQGGSLAPDLTREGSRVRGDWLRRFLDQPNTIRLFLEERMPRFRLSRGDVELLATYIENVLVDPNVPKTVLPPSEITANLVKKGRDLFYETYACDSCHQIGASGGAIGPDLTLAAERLTEGWIYTWLRDSRSLEPEAREPAYNLPDEEARAITAFLLTLNGQALYRATLTDGRAR